MSVIGETEATNPEIDEFHTDVVEFFALSQINVQGNFFSIEFFPFGISPDGPVTQIAVHEHIGRLDLVAVVPGRFGTKGQVGDGHCRFRTAPDLGGQVKCVISLSFDMLDKSEGFLTENRIILAALGTPGIFGDGKSARVEHIFKVTALYDTFRPKIALQALKVFHNGRVVVFSAGGDDIFFRFITVNDLQRQVGIESDGLLVRSILTEIEVVERAGGHNDIVVHPDSLDTPLGTLPGHYRSVIRKTAFQNLVPSDEFLAIGIDDLFHPADAVTLQLINIFQLLVRNPFLAERTHFPVGFFCFISANVHILGGEQIHHFLQHFFKECENLFLSQADDIVDLVLARAEKLGMHVQEGHVVSGDFDFRDDLDLAFCSISNHFTQLILGVISTVNLAIIINGTRDIAGRFL